MRIPGLAQEYERTCQDCGHAWRVPKWAAHPRMQGLPMGGGGRGMAAAASLPGMAAAHAEAVIEANAKLAERVAATRRCPECDSEHYKQRAVRS